MICPKCHKRMKCVNSFNEPETMRTARRYKCTCGEELYTMEQKHDILDVITVLAKKDRKRRNINE